MRIGRAKRLRGEVRTPPDKSILHRALILSSMAQGVSRLGNTGGGRDCDSTRRALTRFGLRVSGNGSSSDRLTIEGQGPRGWREPEVVINCGNSGTTMRLLLGVTAALSHHVVFSGDASLRRRPMKRVVKPLSLMGARISGREKSSRAPLTVQGRRLRPITYTSPVASAQVKSAILLAGLLTEGRTSVKEPYPSRNHTELMLNAMGAGVSHAPGRAGVRGPVVLKPLEMEVPGDISAASFFVGAAASLPGSQVTVNKVGLNPTRLGFLHALMRMGARIELERVGTDGGEPWGTVTVEGAVLSGTEVGEEEVPSLIDELPLLGVIGTQAVGMTVVRGARELRFKESDRIGLLVRELRRLGARMEELPDGFMVEGPTRLVGGAVRSYGDHRLAMALAVAGLFAEGETVIRGSDCVAISYPGFERVLQSLVRSGRRGRQAPAA